MIDTLHLYKQIESREEPLKIAKQLEQCNESINTQTGVIHYTGSIKNLRVSLSASRLYIKGSLTKYHQGTNFNQLSRSGIELAVGELCSSLCVDKDKVQISRLDLAANLMTTYKPEAYFPLMISGRYLDRLENSKTSLYFKNKQKLLVFYDKSAEMTSRGEKLPDLLKDRHYLRYELRLLKQVPARLGLNKLTLSDLYDEQIYMKLIDYWVDEFMAIKKADKIKQVGQSLNSVKDLKSYAVAKLISDAGGQAEMLRLIEQQRAKEQGKSDKSYQRMKAFISNYSLEDEKPSLDMLEEINNKVAARQALYR